MASTPCFQWTDRRVLFSRSSSREHRFAPPRRWRFDFAWPAQRIALEIEGGSWAGGRHVRGRGYEADCEKYSEAALRGWRVLRATPGMVRDGRALALLERAFRALAAGRGKGGCRP
jgi:hypothetical protein